MVMRERRIKRKGTATDTNIHYLESYDDTGNTSKTRREGKVAETCRE